MSAIKALMVDVDGVLVVPRLGGWAADLEGDLGVSKADLDDHFFAVHWVEVVLGKAGLHERLGPVLARIAPGVTSQQLAAYWFAKDAGLDHQLLDDLARVRALGVALHLATVQEHLRADFLWTRLGLSRRFDAMHYAAALGCRKPDAAFFATIEARTGFAPAELLLIDDQAPNVAGALAAGWSAVLWTGEARLADLLRDKLGAV